MTEGEILLEVRDLAVQFPLPRPSWFTPRPKLHAVRGVSFQIKAGRTLALVGESGSGKTTTGMAILKLTPAHQGSVRFRGQELQDMAPASLRQLRRHMQLVFQDPYSALNPRARAGAIVREPLDLMESNMSLAARESRATSLFERVGLRPDQMSLFPHQFSGGQRQRIAIARALATHPALIVCDEPVSALDVAIQAQILNLLRQLQEEFGLAYLFISHDLGVVQFIADEIAVMYLGQIVEYAARADLFTTPRHPYSATLLEAAPSLIRRKSLGYRRQLAISGDPPSPMTLPVGCAFASRCPKAQPRCQNDPPALRDYEKGQVACHFPLAG